MKNLILSTLTFVLVAVLHAQAQTPGATHKEKIAAFSSWIGEWEGEGTMQSGQGVSRKSSVHEKIEFRLDGAVVLVEGVGKSVDPATNEETIVHHALGILSYDATSQEYKFKSYLHDGRSTDAWFKVLENDKYAWGFETPGGKIKYSITINAQQGTWNEIGEFSKDGTQWYRLFEMNLKKK